MWNARFNVFGPLRRILRDVIPSRCCEDGARLKQLGQHTSAPKDKPGISLNATSSESRN